MSEFKDYIESVLRDVKIDSKRRKDIAEEIEDHLNLLKEEYISNNYSKEVAAEMAMKKFGKAEDIRAKYDLVLNPFNKLYIRIPAIILFTLYMLFFMTIFVFLGHHQRMDYGYSKNLIPFKTILSYLYNYNRFNPGIVFENLFGLVIAFIPFGFLITIIHSGIKKLHHIFIASALFSLFIEVIQFVTRKGVADIDDIMLNTLGGIIGFILLNLLVKLLFFLKDVISNINIALKPIEEGGGQRDNQGE